ncbi:MAG: hypothetical protein CSA21_06975 [Deltaproteobacteria bacterium]|nr:MAG: hypothetical protein CSA21_06975 [Deltaproteobacteria bacterium]
MKSILFPHTEIFSIRQFPIFLLVPNLWIYQPSKREKQPEITDCFMKAGFCQVASLPFPDSDEEQRFLKLQEELYTRNDLPRQLIELSLAARTENQEDGEQSERAIRNNLTGEPIREKEEKNLKKNTLWQARLILILKNIFAQQQEDIATRLARIEDSNQTLFSELHGKDKKQNTLLNNLLKMKPHLQRSDSPNMTKCVNAWWQLFGNQVEKEDILLTTEHNTLEPLLTEVERVGGDNSHTTSEISLPVHIGKAPEEACHLIEKFAKKYASLQNKLITEDNWSAEFQSVWNQAVDNLFPSQYFGRQKAKMWCFDKDLLSDQVNEFKYPKRILMVPGE